MSIAAATSGIEHPSDGQPTAETAVHVEVIMLLHQAILDFFRDRPDMFVAPDIFWRREGRNPNARFSPDVMAEPGVRQNNTRARRRFFNWEEGEVTPVVLFRMASRGTWQDDPGDKFDRRPVPRQQGYRLSGVACRRPRKTDSRTGDPILTRAEPVQRANARADAERSGPRR